MFAGRYLWWNTMAAIAYVFFSFYLYYVSWLAIRLSGCAKVVGSCGSIEALINGFLRPYGLLAAGLVVLATGIMRIRFLGMNLLWGLAFFIWFGASGDFFFNLGNLYFAKVGLPVIARTFPVETLFLLILIAFLCFPIELFRASPEGGLRVMSYVGGFTASYAFTFTVAGSAQLPAYVRFLSGSDDLALFAIRCQNMLRTLPGLGGNESNPAIIVALALFLSSLSYLLLMRKKPGLGPMSVPA